MDATTFASLLAAVPSADLRLLELTAELTRPGGALDLDAAAARQHEVEMACAQAQDYANSTRLLSEAVRWKLHPRRS